MRRPVAPTTRGAPHTPMGYLLLLLPFLLLLDPACPATLDQSAWSSSGYHSNQEMESFLQGLVQRFPNLARIYSIGQSVKGNKLLVIQISGNVTQRTVLRPAFKYVANMHGNEAVGRDLTLRLAEHLLVNYWSDRRVQALVDNTDIHMMPSLNPDGFQVATEGQCTGVQGRYNANGEFCLCCITPSTFRYNANGEFCLCCITPSTFRYNANGEFCLCCITPSTFRYNAN
ncbi:hypothetical protein EGW08_009271, partial [Elysia chlorotica]